MPPPFDLFPSILLQGYTTMSGLLAFRLTDWRWMGANVVGQLNEVLDFTTSAGWREKRAIVYQRNAWIALFFSFPIESGSTGDDDNMKLHCPCKLKSILLGSKILRTIHNANSYYCQVLRNELFLHFALILLLVSISQLPTTGYMATKEGVMIQYLQMITQFNIQLYDLWLSIRRSLHLLDPIRDTAPLKLIYFQATLCCKVIEGLL